MKKKWGRKGKEQRKENEKKMGKDSKKRKKGE